ncbi:unnamed protein product, partial [Musa banksii]
MPCTAGWNTIDGRFWSSIPNGENGEPLMSVATHVSGDWMVHPKSKSTKQDKEEASKVFSNPPVRRCQSQQKSIPLSIMHILANITFVFLLSS